jgi:hypothetical protein
LAALEPHDRSIATHHYRPVAARQGDELNTQQMLNDQQMMINQQQQQISDDMNR